MWSHFAILDLSTPDLLIILAIVLLLFGAKRLPELSRSLGSSARELRKGLSEATNASTELKEHLAQTKAPANGEPIARTTENWP
jgi:sec-independent protein translocase protein TatA